ncbi:MAG TPA: VOC family protein [Candidatus Dormibacteraeota bacterium]|nr:VOC family protein [Candidatus Dormibacteraeota bacterium]
MGTTTSKTAIRGIDASVYLVKDLGRAKAFWREVMELQPTADTESYAEYDLGDGTTFGLFKMPDGSWSKCDGILFSVADAREAASYFGARGAKISDNIFDGPACVMAFGEDSEGNAFILHQRKT